MKLNKEDFFNTPLGIHLEECLLEWARALAVGDFISAGYCRSAWEVHKIVLKQFYGLNYLFSNTEERIAICTEDESDYLIKIMKGADYAPLHNQV